jgi:hypothetical protein
MVPMPIGVFSKVVALVSGVGVAEAAGERRCEPAQAILHHVIVRARKDHVGSVLLADGAADDQERDVRVERAHEAQRVEPGHAAEIEV